MDLQRQASPCSVSTWAPNAGLLLVLAIILAPLLLLAAIILAGRDWPEAAAPEAQQ